MTQGIIHIDETDQIDLVCIRLDIISKIEALIKGVGTGMFQTVSFGSWAFIIWVGAVLVTEKKAKGGELIAAVMSILFGAM